MLRPFKLERLEMELGIVPVTCDPEISRNVNSGISVPISSGRNPVMRVEATASFSMRGQPRTKSVKEPSIPGLLLTIKSCSCAILANLAGNEVRRFFCTEREESCGSSAISKGIAPVSSLNERSIFPG